jgi:propanediol dehydratase small subunit
VVAHAANLYGFFVGFDPSRDYPLGLARPDLVTTPGGTPLAALDLDGAGLDGGELRATPETLRLQAEIARASRRPQLADNLLRAAELAAVPDDTILEIYTALRPRRSTATELEEWAARLDSWGAETTAAFVREAAQVYAERGLLAV